MTLETPDKGLVESFDIYRKRKPSTTLVVHREIVEPTLFRNSRDDRAETQEFNGKLHAQVNGEKFTSKERLTGLDLLRRLDDDLDDDLVHDEYAYNEPSTLSESLNVGTVTYGLAGTGTGSEDENFAIKSRVIEGYTYTTEEYNLVNKETRNDVYESGTMRDDSVEREEGGEPGGEQSDTLFDLVKVQPGNNLVHFITLEAATSEMLLYVLHNILNTGKYGARETRTGRNVRNSLIGLVLGNHDTSLSTGELLMDHHDFEGSESGESKSDLYADIGAYIDEVRRSDWEVYGEIGEDSFPDWFNKFHRVASRESDDTDEWDDADEMLRNEFNSLTKEARKTFGVADD